MMGKCPTCGGVVLVDAGPPVTVNFIDRSIGLRRTLQGLCSVDAGHSIESRIILAPGDPLATGIEGWRIVRATDEKR